MLHKQHKCKTTKGKIKVQKHLHTNQKSGDRVILGSEKEDLK